jgi:hypothetical protein
VLALAAIGVEAAVSNRRQKLVIDLGVFLDRRFSRRAFTLLMRVRTDGDGILTGEAIKTGVMCLGCASSCLVSIG